MTGAESMANARTMARNLRVADIYTDVMGGEKGGNLPLFSRV